MPAKRTADRSALSIPADDHTAEDQRFQAAMRRAVEAGLESPPGLEVDKTPGTAKPSRKTPRIPGG
jgi:hypothetical protein